MNFTFNSLQLNGKHGDGPEHEVTFSAEEPGVVAIRIRLWDGDKRVSSPLVFVNAHALIAAVHALVTHEAHLFAAAERFAKHHKPSCAECRGHEPPEDA